MTKIIWVVKKISDLKKNDNIGKILPILSIFYSLPASTVGTITAVPYGSTSQGQENSLHQSLPLPPFQHPVYHAHSQYPATYFPPSPSTMYPGESYGYGFISHPNDQNNLGAQSNMGAQVGPRASHGSQYRGNNYRNNNYFKGRGYGSSNSRHNGNNAWSGSTITRTNDVI